MPADERPAPILAIGAYRPQTGFTRVLWSILTRLGPRYEIHYIGIGYKGPRFYAEGVTVHPCNLRGGDLFGAMQGVALARAIGARAVLLLNDLWMLKNYVVPFAPLQADGVRVVMYAPLDGGLPDASLVAPFSGVDRIVTYTQFARAEIARAIESLEAQGACFACGGVDVLPHGVDPATFHPLAGDIDRQLAPGARRQARNEALPDRPDLQEAFLVLNANRPVPRKRVDLTIDGFARFARGKPPNVKLVLHHAIMSDDERAQILGWADAAGIRDRLVLSTSAQSGIREPTSSEPVPYEAMTDARLNALYNACDVGVNTAMGEGWGLVSFEHAATGAAQIVPRHSACAELWDGAALLLDPVERCVPPFALLEMAAVAPSSLAEALEKLYGDPAARCALARAAYARATQPAWRWTAVAARWDALLQAVTRRSFA